VVGVSFEEVLVAVLRNLDYVPLHERPHHVPKSRIRLLAIKFSILIVRDYSEKRLDSMSLKESQ
jgi:hypothetical protein